MRNTVVDRLMISAPITVCLYSTLPLTRHILLQQPFLMVSAFNPIFQSNERDEWSIAFFIKYHNVANAPESTSSFNGVSLLN